MTRTYCTHLRNHHLLVYEETCLIKGLKHSESIGTDIESFGEQGPQPFTQGMFYHLLMKWIIVDDQVH